MIRRSTAKCLRVGRTGVGRSILLAAFGMLLADSAYAQELVLLGDRVILNSPSPGNASLQRVNFQRSYSAPPLVFVLPDDSSADPATVRVSNITTSGFDISVFESPGEDGRFPSAGIAYLAITPGVYNVAGNTLIANTISTSRFQGRQVSGGSWETVNFGTTFSTPASLLVEIQGSANGALAVGSAPSPWLTVAARNVGTTSAEVALERSETSNGSISSPETIAYLAVASGASGNFGGPGGQVSFSAVRSGDVVTGWDNGCTTIGLGLSASAPVSLAEKSSRDGADGGWLRRCSASGSSIGLTVDEDRSLDSDRSHTTETVSVLSFSRVFAANLPSGAGWEAGNATIPGFSGASLAFTQVSFPESFAAAPLVFSMPTQGDPAPATVRIRAVTSSGFEVAAVEPPGSPGGHESMTLDYLAVLPGQHVFADGTRFEAGSINTSAVQRASNVGGPQGWDSVAFLTAFADPPALLAGLQTTSNSDPDANPSFAFVPWLTVAVDNLSASGVQLALERSEADDGSIGSAERVGYLAFAANRHGTVTDAVNIALAYDTVAANSAASGFDNGCFNSAFTAGFPTTPLAVAHGTTRNGNNGGWLRRCALSSGGIGLHVDEDQDNDSERSHISESVGIVAFERPFRWRPFPDLLLSSTLVSISDVTGGTLPKSIPGAVLEYQITVSNAGRGASDANTVVITDAVPQGTELFVGDLDGSGNPVVFVDGAGVNASGLVFAAAADLSFSDDDGGSYGYSPVAGDWDGAVTNIRINPQGVFAAMSTGSSPTFTIRYRVRVQ